MNNDRLERMKATADSMAIRDNKAYAVVDMGGDYQIWAKAMMNSCGRKYVYATDENKVVENNEWDDLLS